MELEVADADLAERPSTPLSLPLFCDIVVSSSWSLIR